MRNMSFAITTRQMYDEVKDVTRRLGWWHLHAGDVVMAVEKGMGLKKGEKIKRIYPIEILSVRWERLYAIKYRPADLAREGFPELSAEEFIDMFCQSHKGCTDWSVVNRI
jgi:hypothetical protein